MKDWTPKSFRKQIAPRETEFIEYLIHKLDCIGKKVSKKQIEKDLKMSKDTRLEISKRQNVVDLLNGKGICEKAKNWEKSIE